MRGLILFTIAFFCFTTLIAQPDCYLHINAGQSNAYKINDELLIEWENTFKTNNTCDYFEIVNIAKGGTLLETHVNGGLYWDLSTSMIQNKIDFLIAEGCQDIEYTMSWYQGESDAFKPNTTEESYLAGLEQIKTDYSTFIDASLPMIIIEINADEADHNFLTEDFVDAAGVEFANLNSDVTYHEINSENGTYIHQATNNTTGNLENIYFDGIHCNDWYVDQEIAPGIQGWVADEIGWTSGNYSCPCVPDPIIESAMFCEGVPFVWLGEVFNAPGVYEVVNADYHGCENTNELTLTAYPADDENCICTTESFIHFEDNVLSPWISPGGAFSKKMNNNPAASNSGIKSWRIRGDKGVQSSLYANSLDFSKAYELTFHYYTVNLYPQDYFVVEVGTNGNYTTIESFNFAGGIVNEMPGFISVAINEPTADEIRIRTITGNGSLVYLDDILIQECPPGVIEETCDPYIIDFDTGIGVWQSVNGTFSKLNPGDASVASSGTSSWRLRGNHGMNSSIYTEDYIFDGDFELSFHCYPKTVESGDQLIVEGRINNNYVPIQSFTVGVELQNEIGQFHSLTITNPAYDEIRLRAAGNQNNDIYYIDDLLMDGCEPDNGAMIAIETEDIDMVNTNLDIFEETQISVYPNPVSDLLKIDCSHFSDHDLKVEIFDLNGRLIQSACLSQNENELSLASLDNQLLIVHVFGTDVKSRFFKVIKQ